MQTYSLMAHIPSTLLDKFRMGGFNTSARVRSAILRADQHPETLVSAFQQRLLSPNDQTDLKTITFRHSGNVASALQRLSKLTRLSVEQVIRLAMEAYIHV